MFRLICTSLALLVTGYSAFAQPCDSASDATRPLLTNELLRWIDPQGRERGPFGTAAINEADKLTEAEVLKLLPIAYRLAPAPADSESDWIIVCAETTEFVIEVTDGKVSSRSATFHPAARSKDLTPERFRELQDGMTREEVEKMFGEDLHRARDWWSVPTEKRTQQVERWRYVRGREMEIGIAGGKVTGALLKAHVDAIKADDEAAAAIPAPETSEAHATVPVK